MPRPLHRLAFLVVVAFLVLASPPARADEWVGRDKALHFGVSAGIAGGAYGVSALVLEPRWARATVGASVALTAGVAKELLDLAGNGDPSWKDLTWDLLGTAVGVGVALLVDLAIRGAHPGAPSPSASAGAPLVRW